MKRYLVFIALLGLGFGACKKEESLKSDQETVDTSKYVIINGMTYEIAVLKAKMAKFFNLEVDKIGFSAENQSLYLVGYTGEYKLVDLISTLNTITL
ncbi:hypothetical protein [Sphingobacterium sp. WOUb80]|uniref:hypothetical protein n=1 Tax=Sphingobacterium sp. WOUb80 TaxID=3234028 RepID=UPI003CFAAF0A